MPAPSDQSLAHRKAIVARLLATSAVTDIIGQRFYGRRVPDNPPWPFGKYGSPVTTPFEAQGWAGSESEVVIHAFARGPDEATCSALAAAIVDALSGDELTLADGLGLVSLDWIDSQIIADGSDSGNGLVETGDFHAIIRFRIVTTE